THTIDGDYGNALAGRPAWSGTSSGFITTVANLPDTAAGQTIQLRWRCGTDNGNGRTGWRIDTVAISNRVWVCGGSNSPPVLPAQTNRTMAELSSLVVTNTATDTDLPVNALSYTLVNRPAGATIGPSGIITWTPTEIQGPSTNVITTVVTDSGVPPLSVTNSFRVIVTEVNRPPVLPGQSNRVITVSTTLVVTNTATDADVP